MEEENLENKIIKIPIKNLWGTFRSNHRKDKLDLSPMQQGGGVVHIYDIEKLKTSLKEKGQIEAVSVRKLDEEPFWHDGKDHGVTRATYFTHLSQYKYLLLNGNHRSLALLELYGEDYEVNAIIKPKSYYNQFK